MFELSKQFYFEAAHTLERVIETESSRRIHGHTYHAEITVRGRPDPVSGMILDLGLFTRALEAVRARLDHHFLDDVPDLGPATLENLCVYLWRNLAPDLAGLNRVTVWRQASGDKCTYFGPEVN
ncbi:6-pyruvoyl trahydropterin synthase family protein [Elstera cyanobacteriorum]|uniref:6-pyruvoyl trahydropterin synthase family protein n=1 Tax=Elstera cyanobacteriorum TaxID=2022747 RepID=UPI002355E0BC|nr:6-carboxytetrahydropterin synthase [Elstera cyanobacteriorum]MCK6443229.1 6-carboxytetrahydropterin synthase [Elstera cyanobacteriorum]